MRIPWMNFQKRLWTREHRMRKQLPRRFHKVSRREMGAMQHAGKGDCCYHEKFAGEPHLFTDTPRFKTISSGKVFILIALPFKE